VALADGADESSSELKQRAKKHLAKGVEAGAGQSSLVNNVVVARVTLAQLHLKKDRHERAIELLTGGTPSVTEAIGKGSEGRPSEGIRSVAFARLAYTSLIEAYLGAERLDDARAAMATLENIAGPEDSSKLATLHLDLSAGMTASYRELAKSGEQDIDLLTTIATSLEYVLANASDLSTASLLKAASTAEQLAQAVSAPEDARVIHGQAALLYEALLNAGLADEASETAVRFRLARALGQAGQFEDALKFYRELLSEQPNVFDAQFAAAKTMQEWGAEREDPRILVQAISGNPDHPSLWGWAKLSITYQRLLAKDESRADYRRRFLESRLHIAECRRLYARQLTDPKKQESELNKALRELAALARTTASFEAPVWHSLDEIYQSIQRDLGREPEPLFVRKSTGSTKPQPGLRAEP